MALNHTDTELPSLKINNFATLADYQAAYAQGLIDSNELSFIEESLQPDWNQTISTAPDYIKNKPIIGSGVGHDITHTANTTISLSTAEVTFIPNTRCSQMITVSSDLDIAVECGNLSDNYLWVSNIGSDEIDITFSTITHNNAPVANVYMPEGSITIQSGYVGEIGIVCNSDGAFVTSRSDLKPVSQQ